MARCQRILSYVTPKILYIKDEDVIDYLFVDQMKESINNQSKGCGNASHLKPIKVLPCYVHVYIYIPLSPQIKQKWVHIITIM